MTQALLVIDLQQGLCEGEQAGFDHARVIERINHLARVTRAAGGPVVWIQHESPGEVLAWGGPGWQLAGGVETQPSDLRVRKTAADSFHRTDLQPLLQRHGVDTLAVCGMQTQFCVDTTVRRALALGYPVVLVEDAHTTPGNAVLSAQQVIAHHNLTLADIGSFGPRVRRVAAADFCAED